MYLEKGGLTLETTATFPYLKTWLQGADQRKVASFSYQGLDGYLGERATRAVSLFSNNVLHNFSIP